MKDESSRRVGRRHLWVARMNKAKWTRSGRGEVVPGGNDLGTS